MLSHLLLLSHSFLLPGMGTAPGETATRYRLQIADILIRLASSDFELYTLDDVDSSEAFTNALFTQPSDPVENEALWTVFQQSENLVKGESDCFYSIGFEGMRYEYEANMSSDAFSPFPTPPTSPGSVSPCQM